MSQTEAPCPCEVCDNFTLMAGEYCAECMHHGCNARKCLCPRALRSHSYCDFCHTNDVETVKAKPDAAGDRICKDCHPDNKLPERENWWEPPTCPQCGTENPFEKSASCSSCGFIPEDKRM